MADPFISTTDLSDYLGRDLTDDDGAVICVDAACDMVRDVAEITFNEVIGDQISLNGTGTDALVLPEIPVTQAGTVSILGDDGVWTTAGSADYALNGGDVLYATDTAGTSLFGKKWPLGRQNIQVTYDHGYTTAGTAATLPRSVKMVALTLAARLLIQGVAKSESSGGLNISYAAESTGLLPTERLILTKYRRNKPGD